ncbi:30S ribosome-binding factor RbfA [Candidatus Saganbacteria bacterium]|nr:30S ribosome-binding factor RbfA [Candidatus Saganbacteria bacterium]
MSRVERVAELLKEEISRIIREDVNDPRIGFISLTRVDLSPDLEVAKIGVSILANEEKKKECMEGLTSATRFIRGKLGELLTLRFVPQINFIRDDSLEKGSQVLNIISQLKKKEEHERNLPSHKKSAQKR